MSCIPVWMSSVAIVSPSISCYTTAQPVPLAWPAFITLCMSSSLNIVQLFKFHIHAFFCIPVCICFHHYDFLSVYSFVSITLTVKYISSVPTLIFFNFCMLCLSSSQVQMSTHISYEHCTQYISSVHLCKPIFTFSSEYIDCLMCPYFIFFTVPVYLHLHMNII